MSRVICITGGIGSGKSLVASITEALGIPVYHADTRAKALYSDEPLLLQEVVNAFGEHILDEAGNLRKETLAAIAFNNPAKLGELNAIVHPYVRRDFEQWCGFNREKKVLAKEAAILFESGSSKGCDLVIAVTAPIEIRIDRIKKRDNASETEILARIARQWPAEKVNAMADYVVLNDGRELLLPQLTAILLREKLLPETGSGES